MILKSDALMKFAQMKMKETSQTIGAISELEALTHTGV